MSLLTHKLRLSHFFADFLDKMTRLRAVAKNDLPDSTTVRVKTKRATGFNRRQQQEASALPTELRPQRQHTLTRPPLTSDLYLH